MPELKSYRHSTPGKPHCTASLHCLAACSPRHRHVICYRYGSEANWIGFCFSLFDWGHIGTRLWLCAFQFLAQAWPCALQHLAQGRLRVGLYKYFTLLFYKLALEVLGYIAEYNSLRNLS
jgi:hypothetical protein